MPKIKTKNTPTKRTALYRRRVQRSGLSRVEVIVPAADVARVRALANVLRLDGPQAKKLRAQIILSETAKTGAELVSFLRRGAENGFDINLPTRVLDKPRETGF